MDLWRTPKHISDASLRSLIQDIRKMMPFAGVSLLCGSIRSQGIKITREKYEVHCGPWISTKITIWPNLKTTILCTWTQFTLAYWYH